MTFLSPLLKFISYSTYLIAVCFFIIFSTCWPFQLVFATKIKKEKNLVIIVPSYNNAQWYQKNLTSILNQNYSNFRVIYIDDHSADHTASLVHDFIKNYDHQVIDFDSSLSDSIEQETLAFINQITSPPHFFTFIRNKQRDGALANLYRMIQSCKDWEIVVTVDGDDWLADSTILSQLNAVYANKKVWYTHGTLMEYPSGLIQWSEPLPKEAILTHTYRKYKCPSHLRTCYAWLFKKIRLEDLLYEGKFFKMTGDMAIMYPLAEMAAERHAFMKNVLYIYNMSNAINDNKVDPTLQNNLDYWIRHQPTYPRLP